MDAAAVLDHLETLAYRLGIQVRYEHLEGETGFPAGGLCRVRDRQFIIVNSRAPTAEKIQTLTRALRRFDLSGIYLKPALRDLLERYPDDD